MGPRRGCRGKRASASGAAGALEMRRRADFNGAATRVSRKRDERRPVRQARRRLTLQWGRDEGVAENLAAHDRARRHPRARIRLQWGRRRGCRGKRGQCAARGLSSSQASIVASIGAATSEVSRKTRASWKNDIGRMFTQICRPSIMGPRRGVSRKRKPNGGEPVRELHGGMRCTSMGPRRGCRGKRDDGKSSRTQMPTPTRDFNVGPRRGCRGKRSPCHDQGPDDDGYKGLHRGTRRWCRGKRKRTPACKAEGKVGRRRLQWGRDEGVFAENATARDDPDLGARGAHGFQWGYRRRGCPCGKREFQIPGKSRAPGFRQLATSMGPRRGCRGNHGVAMLSMPARSDASNGAATRVSRKTSMSSTADYLQERKLQWGRDEGVAENGARRGWGFPGILTTKQLQWGRDEGVAENNISGSSVSAFLYCFNGAATRVSRNRDREGVVLLVGTDA